MAYEIVQIVRCNGRRNKRTTEPSWQKHIFSKAVAAHKQAILTDNHLALRFNTVRAWRDARHRLLLIARKIYCAEHGGEGGIRTPGRFPVNGFQDRRIRPLCHLSDDKYIINSYLCNIYYMFSNSLDSTIAQTLSANGKHLARQAHQRRK